MVRCQRRPRGLAQPIAAVLLTFLMLTVSTVQVPAQTGGTSAVEFLMEELAEPHSKEWYAAIEWLLTDEALFGTLDLQAATPAVAGALTSGDASTRHHAAWLLAYVRSIDSLPAEALGPLAGALGDANPRVREAAAIALGQPDFGERSLRALMAALEDHESRVRAAALDSLRAFGQALEGDAQRMRAVAARLEDAEPLVRIAAASILRRSADHAGASLDTLIRQWEVSEGTDRRMIAELLQLFWNSGDRRVGDVYAEMIVDGDGRIREIGSAAMARRAAIPSGNAEMNDQEKASQLGLFVDALQDGSPAVRANAAIGLFSLGSGATAAQRPLLQALDREKSFPVRLLMEAAWRAVVQDAPRTDPVEYPLFCVREHFPAMAGISPGDSLQEIQDRLGTPDRVGVAVDASEKADGFSYRFEFNDPSLRIDISAESHRVEELWTDSPGLADTWLGVRIGMSRAEILDHLHVAPTPVRLASPQYVLMDCNPSLTGRVSYLRFDGGDTLKEIELVAAPER